MPTTEQATQADYQLLGVAVSASPEEIKRVYRKLAQANHPDVTGGDKAREAKFKQITTAYERVIRTPLSQRQANLVGRRTIMNSPLARTYQSGPAAISTLGPGDCVWVPPDAVHVSLDRHCYLDPLASFRPYETPRASICVELDQHGYRITFSNAIRHQWAVEDAPIGLSVATILVVPSFGSHRTKATLQYRMPLSFISSLLRNAPAEDVYTVSEAIAVTENEVRVDMDAVYITAPSLRAPVRVGQRGSSHYVRADGKLSDWIRRGSPIGPDNIIADIAHIGNTTISSTAKVG